ncbi:MAG TPA: hypothetical protein VMW36_01535 [Patescibacteria group bacterium]|nr:hypothetical protein [Patescibacteria group bacterium]
MIHTRLFNINSRNNDDVRLEEVQKLCLERFPDEALIGAEFGVAFGGGLEAACRVFGERGRVLGLDTFNGHPRHLSDEPDSFEATCMDHWYEKFGLHAVSEEHISSELYACGIHNYELIAGEVHENSISDSVENLHYVLLDLDLIEPMKVSYENIKDKMVKGGFICVHDVLPADHLPLIHEWWYNEVMPTGRYKEHAPGKYLGVYEVL